MRNSDNTGWITLGITAEDIGAAKKLVGNKSDIPETANTYDLFFAVDEKKLYYFSGTSWEVGLSLNIDDFLNFADKCISPDEVDYSGKDKILRLDKTTGKGNIDISGSAKKIDGVGINLNDLENGKAIAYDKNNKMFVADKNIYLSSADVSDSGEVGKIVKLGTDKIIHADIDGSAEKVDGVEVDVTGIKDGQVLAYEVTTKTLKPANKDYFGEKSVSETGEVGKIIRLGSDKTVHANLDGSASKLDGIAADLSGIKNNQVLSYDSTAKEIIPKDIDAKKIGGVIVDTAGIEKGQVLIYAAGNKFIPSDKDFITADDISTTGEVGKLVKIAENQKVAMSISGSADEVDGVKFYASGANDGEILVYHSATNSFSPEPKNSAGEGKFLVLKNGDDILVEFNGSESKELDISPLTKIIPTEAAQLSAARKIKLTGLAEGETEFDGSKNVELEVTALKIDDVENAKNSETADKLKTPRTISVSGKITADPVEFDGSSNIVLNVTSIDVEEQESVNKLKTARKFTITGDAEGILYFDGSEDVTMELKVLKAENVTGVAEKATVAQLAGNANTAAEATLAYKAINDSNGDAIHETYVKKSELAALIAELNS